MRYRSTSGQSSPVDFETALFQGLAPDGGLYMPERIPELPDPAGPSLVDTALAVLRPYLEEIPEKDLRPLLAEALDFEIPLSEPEPGIHILELFHGPTHAFKDVGARVMARLIGWFLRDGDPITILVATSGDTGGAVAHAFLGVPNTSVVVLYPHGKVSGLQEKQFTTLGGNVRALAVEGTFDDCQRMAKEAFADQDLRKEVRLTSANSINLGRLLPQAAYYVHATRLMPEILAPPLFCTPSGNFGNLCAGMIARRMGMPCHGFITATNVNDVVPEFLETGKFRPRPSIPTISNAMDVGNPGNFARILDLYGNDAAALRADLQGSRHDDDATREAIREVQDRTGVILDPHTAVGYLAVTEAFNRGAAGPVILLATAHPAKFREHVEPLIGRTIPVPGSLAACLERESRAEKIPAETGALKRLLSA